MELQWKTPLGDSISTIKTLYPASNRPTTPVQATFLQPLYLAQNRSHVSGQKKKGGENSLKAGLGGLYEQ